MMTTVDLQRHSDHLQAWISHHRQPNSCASTSASQPSTLALLVCQNFSASQSFRGDLLTSAEQRLHHGSMRRSLRALLLRCPSPSVPAHRIVVRSAEAVTCPELSSSSNSDSSMCSAFQLHTAVPAAAHVTSVAAPSPRPGEFGKRAQGPDASLY